MALEDNSGEFISLQEAISYVTAFRREYPTQPKAFFANGDKISQILSQDDCIGIRIYNGYTDVERRNNLVIVGVDSREKDMTEGLIMEKTGMCPPWCDVTSVLCQ